MEKRTLGHSDLQVSALCLGGNVFGWTADEATSFQVLDAFVADGGNFIDTANVYSRWAPGNQGGESETIIGKWLKQRGGRDQLVIATKVGGDMGNGQKGLSRNAIKQAVDESLRRLQTDYIDLYQAHFDDPETPFEETLDAFAELVREGKVRVIGASNLSASRLAEALSVSKQHGYPRYESLQPLYNLYDRADYEQDLEPLCKREGLGVISYYSLASGFLTGKYRSEKDLPSSQRAGSVKEQYMNDRGFRILKALDNVAQKYNATPAQISLAWLMTRVTAPIASATSATQVHEIAKAAAIQLDKASIAELDQASNWK
ncbi:aryl-alcohol dehydrogenase-like predicted oxidoreductase [Thermosporothrix hazakensis]|jgi:aryl-alcohol dehydrogenase-like predicted oxidoreductase|uniref:Aryl-alcohol dehydrogenase-like predicted oxidoreductase n=2 Tax=Thermosporothrix TaxID=768650 RepID=A0A326U5Q9_THEHA|nr:aldo/keto reductase [Thermosporothrix hazakensis]PZW28024.1 aryl-alcohol dehydrogenase-like predicted oxidoreductase [Thermosporothrix hazakensis]BBH86954.1 oxidoreductase [Thermosporothrix sp. COM3]GCE51245.1 oxidoreductase [Thermosporothrix hazakensis]